MNCCRLLLSFTVLHHQLSTRTVGRNKKKVPHLWSYAMYTTHKYNPPCLRSWSPLSPYLQKEMCRYNTYIIIYIYIISMNVYLKEAWPSAMSCAWRLWARNLRTCLVVLLEAFSIKSPPFAVEICSRLASGQSKARGSQTSTTPSLMTLAHRAKTANRVANGQKMRRRSGSALCGLSVRSCTEFQVLAELASQSTMDRDEKLLQQKMPAGDTKQPWISLILELACYFRPSKLSPIAHCCPAVRMCPFVSPMARLRTSWSRAAGPNTTDPDM